MRLVVSNLWFLCLGCPLSAPAGKSYAYEVARTLDASLGAAVPVASISRVLKSLEEAGYVESQEGEPHESIAGTPRRYFLLTKEGRKKFDDAREAVDRYRLTLQKAAACDLISNVDDKSA
ncbi:MAG: hypothetical protein CMJ18_11330 [Phycisphaeraceae bacterium]|nr:hypothetical protein [Phycisphaeraceae bacterium]